MKAMILAAGLGTRLRPLTDTRPKALVEINGRTLLEITLSRLRSFGVNEVIVNVHHLADMIADYLKSKGNFGMRIELSREDDLLLDTGGGLKKASWFFLEHASPASSKTPLTKDSRQGTASAVPKSSGHIGALAPEAGAPSRQVIHETSSSQMDEPFLLHNVDVLSTIDLHRMLQFHTEHHALATLAVQSRESSRLLLFNDALQLSGRSAPAEKASGTGIPACASASSHSPLATRHSPLPLAFSGIHVVSPRLLPMLTETGVFSIIDAYLRLAALGEKILAFRADEYYWRDLGRASDLSQASLDLQ